MGIQEPLPRVGRQGKGQGFPVAIQNDIQMFSDRGIDHFQGEAMAVMAPARLPQFRPMPEGCWAGNFTG